MTLTEYADREMLSISLANKLAGQLGEALRGKDRVTLCVPGGTTPGPIFDDLCDVDLDWSRIDVVLGDERWVPEDHGRSNTRLIRKRLFQNKAAAATMLPLYKPADRPEEVLDELGAGIEPHLPIDVLLLGMGTDWHTASIFPGADRLEEALSPDAPVLLAMRAPGADEPRITLSARVLNEAMSKHVLIMGPEKREALDAAKGRKPDEAPINAVLDEAEVHWAE